MSGTVRTLPRNRATTFVVDGISPAIFDLHHTIVFDKRTAPADGIRAIRTEGQDAIGEISVTKVSGSDATPEDEDDEHLYHMYKTVSNVLVDEPDLVYTHFLQLSQCYQAMATNNKVVVFTDDLSVRKAFYALVSNSTRTGLIADSNTMNLTGVLSITDFTMVLMMLWKYRENIEEMRGTPLTQLQFNEMDIANMEIKRWKELLRKRGNQREFISVNTSESLFHAVELLSKHRIHRLPVLDKHSGDCAFILTHRRVLHYIWKYCSCLSRPDYMSESAFDLKVGTYTGIHYATQEMPLLEVLDMMIDNSISGVPIIQESTMKIVDVYTRFDAVSAALSRAIDMSISVAEAIRQRQTIYGTRDGVVTAPERATMWDLVEMFVEKNVHRIFLVDEFQRMKGLVSLSDLIMYMILRPSIAWQHRKLSAVLEK
ncbi:unnamed protein product [Cylicocyclus nassatus]|uniref:CBS domain-containing protein n=1 Tax=Cylicocyclus nassatus TaxID=53992 RepID=A0AA36HFV4_CYLNA|nr:unnamed protein product [Cylicocyclus nassatus]